ncbi:MAG: EamA family transporter [Rhodobacteraceae bacterium]|nr:EamA family transporter [Paracoccaceae bacterium]
MRNQAVINWMLLLFLGLIWGSSFLGVKLSLDSFGPITVAAIRVTIAAIILTSISFYMGHGLPATNTATGRKIWRHGFGMAIFTNAVPFTLLSWAQIHVSTGYAGITMAVVPLLVLPLSHFFIPGERLSPQKTFGFAVGFAGVVILIGPAQILESGGGDIENIARIACVIASFCYATGSIITRLAPSGPQMAFSSAALLLAAAMLVPVALIVEGFPDAPTQSALLGVLYLGLFPTALATVILVYVIKAAGPPFLSLVNYQVPVWAVVIGMVVLNETLPGQFVWALGLILIGLGVSQAKIWRSRP